MDHEVLVEETIEEGRRLIARLAEEPLTINVAAWVKPKESRLWTIYIGVHIIPQSDELNDKYSMVFRALAKMSDPKIVVIDIHLVDAASPVAVDLLALRERYPTMVARKLKTRRRIGHLETRGLYIYPPTLELAPPSEIVHNVLQLLDRRGDAPPSVVTFRDGSRIHAVPVGIRLNTPDGARIDWHDVTTSQERSVSASEVVSIL